MCVTVAGQFMASFCNLANQRRIAFGYPTQHEESSSPIVFGEKRKDAFAIRVDASSKCRPVFRTNLVSKCLDVKIVFDVDAERVCNWVEYLARRSTRLVLDRRTYYISHLNHKPNSGSSAQSKGQPATQ